MISCIRRHHFCAAHRLLGHGGKCLNLHGHNYVAYIHVQAEEVDEMGMVVDFDIISQKIGGWIDANWDHGFIGYNKDTSTINYLKSIGSKYFIMDCNTTAENLSQYLLKVVAPEVLQNTGATVNKVVLWETESCIAEATL